MSASAPNLSPQNSLAMKMAESIQQLIDQAIQLREALISRQTATIWELLSHKQEKLAQFEQFLQLWNQLYAGESVSEEHQRQREHLQSMLSQLKTLEQRNAYLSNSYLIAIRRAFEHAGVTSAAQTRTYDKRGQYGKAKQALIVRKMG
ncbi:MAG: hypothetical protein D6820_05225 [Lentisphaerae bacterium]|nr:MAG: hypothetical protein D6820_05225 [Lentisphaerota bacterium]